MYNERYKLLYNMLITQGTNLLVQILPNINTKTLEPPRFKYKNEESKTQKIIMKPDQ
jgi:hypothetical protein